MRGNFHVRFGKGATVSRQAGAVVLVHYSPSVMEAFNSIEHISECVL